MSLRRKILYLLAFIPYLSDAQTSEPSSIYALGITNTIVLDGFLNEEAWKRAKKISNFTQRELNFGKPVTQRTEVAVLYDEEYLYIGAWCYDSTPEKIIAKELKRDFDYSLDDNFIIILDTYKDKRNGFMFVTNPNAARTDLQIFNNGASTNVYWNGVWDVQTTRNQDGWFAEFRIPFYTLKYRTTDDVQTWGINFERNIRRNREQARWQGWSRDNQMERVSVAGELWGLSNLRNRQFIAIKPYGIAGGENSRGTNKGLANIGGDVNYLLSPTYRMNITVNTDFAQVESDRQQVNITRFPLYFPELREFFLEGADYFDMGFGGNRIVPFYSRRIGLNEDRQAVPIIAGGRILGKEQNRTVGLMSIQTAQQGDLPSTNYSAASWRQDIGTQSIIGGMTANTFARGRWHTTTGINGRYSTSEFLKSRNLDIGGAYIHTYNTDTTFQKKAYAYRAYLNYSNDRWQVFASSQQSPEPFNPEVGLMRRRNFLENFALVAFKPRPKKRLKWIRQFDFRPGMVTITQFNDTRKIQTLEYVTRVFGMDTRSGETITMDVTYQQEGLISAFEIHPEITIPASRYKWVQYEAGAQTYNGRTLSLSTVMIWGGFYSGKAIRNQSQMLWRAGKNVNFMIQYQHNSIDLEEGSFKTNLIGSRVEYAISPNAFGSFLGQWNNSDEQMIVNFRLRLIPVIGTDFYLIVNQVYDTGRPEGFFYASRSTVLGKLIWRFVL